MKRATSRNEHEGQSVSESTVYGHVFQFSNTVGDISIDTEWTTEDLASPGNLSISPPSDHLGRPIHGRDNLTKELIGLIQDRDVGPVIVLSGLGGCGKSTLAMLLAEKCVDLGTSVWWISANSLDTLHAGMRQLSAVLGAPQKRLVRAWSGQESATDLLWELLAQHEKQWLIIFDGADDPSLLAESGTSFSNGTGWVRPPPRGRGSIVITTRDHDPRSWGSWCAIRTVGMLSPTEATAVLSDYAGPSGGSAKEAEALAIRLGCLPLALRLAGTYIQSKSRFPWPGAINSFTGYLQALEEQITKLFPELDEDSSAFADRQAREMVGCTWELSLSALEDRGFSESRTLLQLLSHFADNPIPVEFLNDQVLNSLPKLSSLQQERLHATLEALTSLGLIDLRTHQRDTTGVTASAVTLTLHPLVREVGRYPRRLHNPRTAYLAIAASMVADAAHSAPQPDWTSWPIWEAISVHAFYLLSETTKEDEIKPAVINAAAYGAYKSAQFLINRGEFERARNEQLHALEALDGIVETDHPNSLLLRHDLGVTLGRLGQLAEAEVKLHTVKEQKSKIFGPQSKEALATMHAYADVLWQQGELSRAEAEYRSIVSTLAGDDEDDRNLWGTKNNFYQVLVEQGKHAEVAAEIDDLVSEAMEKGFGDTAIAQARFTRARVRMAEARFEESIAELHGVVDLHTETLGETHPVTLSSRHELGVALQKGGRATEACQVLRPVFMVRTKTQGTDHPETLATRHQLAVALHEAGEREEAKRHYIATLKYRSKTLGDRHMNTLATRFQLAVLLEEAGNTRDAEDEFLQVLIDECASIGADHPNTLITRSRLVNLMIGRGQLPQALAELNRILIAQRRIYGEAHPIPRETESVVILVETSIDSSQE